MKLLEIFDQATESLPGGWACYDTFSTELHRRVIRINGGNILEVVDGLFPRERAALEARKVPRSWCWITKHIKYAVCMVSDDAGPSKTMVITQQL